MGQSDLTPLQLASYGSRVQACAYLIERGADVDLGPLVRDGQPLTTPLAYASTCLSIPQLRLLLDAHANPNVRYQMDGGGIRGPLASAISSCRDSERKLDAVQLLVRHGAKTDIFDRSTGEIMSAGEFAVGKAPATVTAWLATRRSAMRALGLLRRVAPVVGRCCLVLLELADETREKSYAPGGAGSKRARSHFETLAHMQTS